MAEKKHSYIIIISIIFLVTLIFSSSILLSKTVSKKVKSMTTVLETVSDSLKNGDFEKALSEYDDFCQSWHRAKVMWHVYLHHSKISEVDFSVERLSNQILMQNESDAIVECGVIIHLFENISQLDQLNLENIF